MEGLTQGLFLRFPGPRHTLPPHDDRACVSLGNLSSVSVRCGGGDGDF